jgi:Cupredoxin-like domain
MREMALNQTATIEDVNWQETFTYALHTSIPCPHHHALDELHSARCWRLTIKNLDSTPAEFESHTFKAEKVIPAVGEVSLFIGPLNAGTYDFFDDFHEDQTKGTLIAK